MIYFIISTHLSYTYTFFKTHTQHTQEKLLHKHLNTLYTTNFIITPNCTLLQCWIFGELIDPTKHIYVFCAYILHNRPRFYFSFVNIRRELSILYSYTKGVCRIYDKRQCMWNISTCGFIVFSHNVNSCANTSYLINILYTQKIRSNCLNWE